MMNVESSANYLVKQQNEVDCKGHKQSQHSHVVEVSCKIVLQEKRQRHRVKHTSTWMALWDTNRRSQGSDQQLALVSDDLLPEG